MYIGVFGQLNEPNDIERRAGEKDVHISCEIFIFEERVPFWRINGIDYVKCNLPQPYVQTPSGLEIKTVTRDMDGTSFQCLLPSQNDLSIKATRIGVLTVTGNGKLWTFLSPIDNCGVLYVAIITDPAAMVKSVHDKQKVGGLNPCLPKQFFLDH